MINIDSPCKGCEHRFVGCHSECLQYAEFWDKIMEIREEIKKKSVIEENCRGYHPTKKQFISTLRDSKSAFKSPKRR